MCINENKTERFGLDELPLEPRMVTFSLGACRRIWLQIKETSRDCSVFCFLRESTRTFANLLPYRTAPMNASPAPVVSRSSSGGIFSAVPSNNLPLTVPIPSAFNFVISCTKNVCEWFDCLQMEVLKELDRLVTDETHVGNVVVESFLCFSVSNKLSMSVS